MRVGKFAEGLGDGIDEMGAVIRSYMDDPDKLLESGESIANTALTLTTLLAEGPIAAVASAVLLVEMAAIMWNSPELIHYSAGKEDVAYESGKIIGGMLLVFAIFKSTKDAINALKSDIHVQYMVTSAKLQMQGILSKSDAITALAGKISSILKCVEGSFTVEAMKYLEQYLAAEKGSRFLEVVRKLEKELGDKIELDTAEAKKIVESLDDGMSVDEVVAEMKACCERKLMSADDIFTAGKNVFDDFDINNACVKPKHLSTTGGNGQKFIGASKAEAEGILKDALSNGNIVSITDNGLTSAGNASYEIIIDAGKAVGTKGENLVKIVISSDGGMLSAYPIK